MTTPESEEPAVLVCMRLADMVVVHPAQIEGLCHKCGAIVGIYPTGQRALKTYPKMKITCVQCTLTEKRMAHDEDRPAGSMKEIIQESFESVPVRKT